MKMEKFERNERREREKKENKKKYRDETTRAGNRYRVTRKREREKEKERESNTRERGRWRGEGRRSSGIQSRDSCLPKDLQSQAENATASVGGSL